MGNNCCSQPAETVNNFDLKKTNGEDNKKADD